LGCITVESVTVLFGVSLAAVVNLDPAAESGVEECKKLSYRNGGRSMVSGV